MLEHKKIRSLDDYFVDLNGRQSREVYFYRINGYTEKIGDFSTNSSITKFYGYLVFDFTGLPIHPPLGALNVGALLAAGFRYK